MLSTWLKRILKGRSKPARRQISARCRHTHLQFEELESRLGLSNLAITSTRLTDVAGNVLNPPPVGGMAYVQVEFDTKALPAAAQYTIRTQIDADTKDFVATC